MMRNFDKHIWDENDFDKMGWHDSKIYAIAFEDDNFELMFDIDYILEWVNPEESESNYKFWVSPCTLVFRNVWNLDINLETGLNLEILDLHRANITKSKNESSITESSEYDWKVEINNGDVSFRSVGYRQYFRRSPVLIENQSIGLLRRGGISFDIEIND